MDVPLSTRAVHFLKKAGPKAFLRKCRLVIKHRLAARRLRGQVKIDEQRYQEKLKSLPVEEGHVTVPVLDFQMKLRANDQGLSRQLILDGVREKDAVEYLRPLLPRFRTIVEIGANQGYYAILEALNTPDDARIYAFEPHPDNVATLKLNLSLNGCAEKFAGIHQAAVSDRAGTAELRVHQLSNWHSLSRVDLPGGGGWKERVNVPTVTLDQYCGSNDLRAVDFIRMDVEGHEAEIVKGAEQILRASPNCTVFIEIHSSLLREAGHRPEELLERLASLGFRKVTACGKGRQLTTSNWKQLIRNLELLMEEYGNHLFFSKNG